MGRYQNGRPFPNFECGVPQKRRGNILKGGRCAVPPFVSLFSEDPSLNGRAAEPVWALCRLALRPLPFDLCLIVSATPPTTLCSEKEVDQNGTAAME